MFLLLFHTPTISNKVIRSLGIDFCKVEAAKVDDQALTKKRKPKSTIGEGKKKDAEKNESNSSDDTNEDKIKKTKKK